MSTWFLSYLWGMETTFWERFLSLFLSSYPTYEEWKLTSYCIYYFVPTSVLILPMRNGNYIAEAPTDFLDLGSYPTYEEWKQKFHFIFPLLLSVLILPMRNGNIYELMICNYTFRSYPTYEEWKHRIYKDC